MMNHAKFLRYKALHEELKVEMDRLGLPIQEDGQLYAFASLLRSKPVHHKERPSMAECVRTVLGSDTMSVLEIVLALNARGWAINSDEPRSYLTFFLHSKPEIFELVDPETTEYRLKAAA